ncbi:unnamed protein product, partial [Closterium sp. NIES-53]
RLVLLELEVLGLLVLLEVLEVLLLWVLLQVVLAHVARSLSRRSGFANGLSVGAVLVV